MTAPVVPLRPADDVGAVAHEALGVVSRHLDRCKLSARTVRAYKRQAAAYAGGLKADDLARQADEIDEANGKLEGIRILKGVEADILQDGSLDVPDDVLQRFPEPVRTFFRPAAPGR